MFKILFFVLKLAAHSHKLCMYSEFPFCVFGLEKSIFNVLLFFGLELWEKKEAKSKLEKKSQTNFMYTPKSHV